MESISSAVDLTMTVVEGVLGLGKERGQYWKDVQN